MYFGCSWSHIVTQVSLTISATVEQPILNSNANALKELPVARYLKEKKHSLIYISSIYFMYHRVFYFASKREGIVNIFDSIVCIFTTRSP